jgi:hypothetical protein
VISFLTATSLDIAHRISPPISPSSSNIQINRKFAEARDEIEFAKEDAETTYFNESCEDAKLLVDDVLLEWTTVLGKLSDDERSKLQRSMGLKIEQLKAEMEELNHLHAD